MCCISEKSTIAYGVPQGSILGPLLFLLYMNDMQYRSKKLSFFLFADDTNILYANKNIKSVESTCNEELFKVFNWLTANKLTLNIKKSNYVIFRPYQKILPYQPNISIYDNEKGKPANLECKEYVKYLGILIDNNLPFKNHIEHITIKISKTVGMIAKLRHFVPKRILLQIYQSLIVPYISYAVTVWGHASKCHLNKILILQKRVFRFMSFSDRSVHAVPLFVNTNILPINFVYFESLCCLMHDIRNRVAPINIINLFTDTSSVHSYNTRSQNQISFT